MIEHKIHVDLHIHQPPGVPAPPDAVVGLLREVLTALSHLHQQGDRIMALIDDLRAQFTTLTGTVGNIETEVTGVAAEVAALLASIQPGSTLTQADVDALSGINTRLQAASDALKAIPPAPSV